MLIYCTIGSIQEGEVSPTWRTPIVANQGIGPIIAEILFLLLVETRPRWLGRLLFHCSP